MEVTFPVGWNSNAVRQQNDTDLGSLLLRLRVGEHTNEDLDIVKSRYTDGHYPINIRSDTFTDSLRLYPTRDQCNAYNSACLDALPTKKI